MTLDSNSRHKNSTGEIGMTTEIALPVLISSPDSVDYLEIDNVERNHLQDAMDLCGIEKYGHALISLWDASIHNLRRRIEAYSEELFLSAIKNEPGRKHYKKDGDTIADRWDDVDDSVVIIGAKNIGLLEPKASKALEMINWMRNHATPAHDTNNTVNKNDVIAMALMLQENLFMLPLPEPGHSIKAIIDPIRKDSLTEYALDQIGKQIETSTNTEIRVIFGFMLDLILAGDEPAWGNVNVLFSVVWEKASDTLRSVAGNKYNSLCLVSAEVLDNRTKEAKQRLLEMLIKVKGVKYIPDATRAKLYGRAADILAKAKDTSYGWKEEERAAKTLEQLGPYVPSLVFVHVYQEILSVWCGNYWGRSNAYSVLSPFIDVLQTEKIRALADLFKTNDRVRDELCQQKPKNNAISLLESLKCKLTINSHKNEIDDIISNIRAL